LKPKELKSEEMGEGFCREEQSRFKRNVLRDERDHKHWREAGVCVSLGGLGVGREVAAQGEQMEGREERKSDGGGRQRTFFERG